MAKKLEFVSEVEEIEGENEVIEFTLDGRVYKVHRPTVGQSVLVAAAFGRGQSSVERVATIVNIISECMDEEDRDHFVSRLLSRENRIPEKTIIDIFQALMEEWFGRPSEEP